MLLIHKNYKFGMGKAHKVFDSLKNQRIKTVILLKSRSRCLFVFVPVLRFNHSGTFATYIILPPFSLPGTPFPVTVEMLADT